jgi:hypothetical protein
MTADTTRAIDDEAEILPRLVRCAEQLVAEAQSTKQQTRVIWAAAKSGRGLAANELIKSEFIALANRCGVIAARGRYVRDDVRHVIRWALRGWNPFERGPLT